MDVILRWLVLTTTMLIISNKKAMHHRHPEAARRGRYSLTLKVTSDYVVMDNGIIQLTLANPYGYVTGIRYNGVDNLLEFGNGESNRGYFDVVWDAPGRCGNNSNSKDCIDGLDGTMFNIIRNSSDRTEISFSAKWDQSSWNGANYPNAPINLDRRYVMYKGLAGFYSYKILDREANFPQANIHQIRAVYKLHKNMFHYMAMSDDRQRLMPMPKDRASGQVLDYKEAVRLIDPVNPDMKGEVDDKYQYACEDIENKLHGWIADNPTVGFWLITPSDEFRSAGPFKQDLTSHMFHSAHYAGSNVALAFKQGEAWKKVFGPFLVYLNSNKNYSALWQDAKIQMKKETKRWPYQFPLSMDFAKPGNRGSVSGRLFVKDRFGNKVIAPARNAWVGLAAIGDAGSWQVETKGYQFWVMTKKDGNFVINGVLEGTYDLYATIPGFIGDYKYTTNIQIKADRTASEFFVPNPIPTLVNKLFIDKPQHKFRQYGLWRQYTELYPNNDLVYTIGTSDFRRDWFFAHVPRKVGNITKPTTWQIVFSIAKLEASSIYKLRIAIASASGAEIQVRFNDYAKNKPHFTTKLFGKDNAIARHGIHGLYKLFSVDVLATWLRPGNNILYLTQTRYKSQIDGVMYDYIRFEGPPGEV
ncbi:hypothetical protein V2J09_001998 [Rumex salicifolius]